MVERISRRDIEQKVRDIQGGVDEDIDEAKTLAVPVVVAIVLALLGLTYVLGRRSGRKRSMVVEVRSR